MQEINAGTVNHSPSSQYWPDSMMHKLVVVA
jgi:hypothetical protein